MRICDIDYKSLSPKGWDTVKLRQAFSFGKGLSITKDDLVEEGIPVISYGQIHSRLNTGTGLNEALIRYVPDSYLSSSPKCLMQKNDIVFADTSEDYAGVGNCAFIDSDTPIFAGYHSIIARPILKSCYPKYYAYLFQTDYWRNQIRAQVMGIKVFSITQTLLRDTFILVPPQHEQKAISDYLDTICPELDSITAKLIEQIDTLKAYKKSLITETVTEGLIKSVPMKESGIDGIGRIPAHWDAKRLKYVLAKPLQYGANEAGDDFEEGHPRYIRITDITEDNLLKEDGKQSLSWKLARQYLLEDGDVLFARSGATVGKTFFYTDDVGPAAFAGYLIKAQTDKKKMLPRFLFYLTLGVGYENWKNSIFTQATIQNIGADKYSQLPVTVPPITEQEAILEYLDHECKKIDSTLFIKSEQLSAIQKYKSFLIYEYVTGKKRVKEVQ